MKTILNTLLLSAAVLCELPPPYSQRGFRPSPQFSNQFSSLKSPQIEYGPPKREYGPPRSPKLEYGPPKQLYRPPKLEYGPPKEDYRPPRLEYGPPKQLYRPPKLEYGPPKEDYRPPRLEYGPPKLQYKPQRLQSNDIDVELPSKLTIEQLIRLTEQLHSSQGRIVNNPQIIRLSTPHNSYLPPPRLPENTYEPSKGNLEFSHSQLRPPPVSQPQIDYGAPQISHQTFRPSKPQNQYGPPPQNLNTGSGSQSYPQTTYGVPNAPQPGGSNNEPNPQIPPSTNYGVPDLRSIETLGELRNKPLSDQDILRQNLLSDLSKQHLPYREPTGFRPQGSQNNDVQNVHSVGQQYVPGNNNLQQGSVSNPSQTPQNSGSVTGSPGTQGFGPPNVPQQYVPPTSSSQYPQNALGTNQPGSIPSSIPQSGIGVGNSPQNGNGGGISPSFPPFETTPAGTNLNNGGGVNNAGQNYLPPQTTPRPVLATRPTTSRPRSLQTTPQPSEETTNYDYDYNQQPTLLPTEPSTNQDGSASDPNVSISNAVAGGGGFFYLQQPDGRLQKVVLQKTQEPNSKPEEYVANYYFQNIQALPTVTYTPLVTVGAWK